MTRHSMPILLAVGVLACVAFGGLHGDDLSIVDVFLWLLVFLIVSGAACGRGLAGDQRAELAMERVGWGATAGRPRPRRVKRPNFRLWPRLGMRRRHLSYFITEYLADLCASVADGNCPV